eukprot:TRINITY_DN3220_c0_g6_i3.p1 TRINITY_DN3220_c0_g6~~TRINITY_DN3220_c0_g6_i3.p1  ORF type:complete len:3122 (+),score=799.03 TRINITY_DN3220_c0_g6_i3:1189-9366(+)
MHGEGQVKITEYIVNEKAFSNPLIIDSSVYSTFVYPQATLVKFNSPVALIHEPYAVFVDEIVVLPESTITACLITEKGTEKTYSIQTEEYVVENIKLNEPMKLKLPFNLFNMTEPQGKWKVTVNSTNEFYFAMYHNCDLEKVADCSVFYGIEAFSETSFYLYGEETVTIDIRVIETDITVTFEKEEDFSIPFDQDVVVLTAFSSSNSITLDVDPNENNVLSVDIECQIESNFTFNDNAKEVEMVKVSYITVADSKLKIDFTEPNAYYIKSRQIEYDYLLKEGETNVMNNGDIGLLDCSSFDCLIIFERKGTKAKIDIELEGEVVFSSSMTNLFEFHDLSMVEHYYFVKYMGNGVLEFNFNEFNIPEGLIEPQNELIEVKTEYRYQAVLLNVTRSNLIVELTNNYYLSVNEMFYSAENQVVFFDFENKVVPLLINNTEQLNVFKLNFSVGIIPELHPESYEYSVFVPYSTMFSFDLDLLTCKNHSIIIYDKNGQKLNGYASEGGIPNYINHHRKYEDVSELRFDYISVSSKIYFSLWTKETIKYDLAWKYEDDYVELQYIKDSFFADSNEGAKCVYIEKLDEEMILDFDLSGVSHLIVRSPVFTSIDMTVVDLHFEFEIQTDLFACVYPYSGQYSYYTIKYLPKNRIKFGYDKDKKKFDHDFTVDLYRTLPIFIESGNWYDKVLIVNAGAKSELQIQWESDAVINIGKGLNSIQWMTNTEGGVLYITCVEQNEANCDVNIIGLEPLYSPDIVGNVTDVEAENSYNFEFQLKNIGTKALVQMEFTSDVEMLLFDEKYQSIYLSEGRIFDISSCEEAKRQVVFIPTKSQKMNISIVTMDLPMFEEHVQVNVELGKNRFFRQPSSTYDITLLLAMSTTNNGYVYVSDKGLPHSSCTSIEGTQHYFDDHFDSFLAFALPATEQLFLNFESLGYSSLLTIKAFFIPREADIHVASYIHDGLAVNYDVIRTFELVKEAVSYAIDIFSSDEVEITLTNPNSNFESFTVIGHRVYKLDAVGSYKMKMLSEHQNEITYGVIPMTELNIGETSSLTVLPFETNLVLIHHEEINSQSHVIITTHGEKVTLKVYKFGIPEEVIVGSYSNYVFDSSEPLTYFTVSCAIVGTCSIGIESFDIINEYLFINEPLEYKSKGHVVSYKLDLKNIAVDSKLYPIHVIFTTAVEAYFVLNDTKFAFTDNILLPTLNSHDSNYTNAHIEFVTEKDISVLVKYDSHHDMTVGDVSEINFIDNILYFRVDISDISQASVEVLLDTYYDSSSARGYGVFFSMFNYPSYLGSYSWVNFEKTQTLILPIENNSAKYVYFTLEKIIDIDCSGFNVSILKSNLWSEVKLGETKHVEITKDIRPHYLVNLGNAKNDKIVFHSECHGIDVEIITHSTTEGDQGHNYACNGILKLSFEGNIDSMKLIFTATTDEADAILFFVDRLINTDYGVKTDIVLGKKEYLIVELPSVETSLDGITVQLKDSIDGALKIDLSSDFNVFSRSAYSTVYNDRVSYISFYNEGEKTYLLLNAFNEAFNGSLCVYPSNETSITFNVDEETQIFFKSQSNFVPVFKIDYKPLALDQHRYLTMKSKHEFVISSAKLYFANPVHIPHCTTDNVDIMYISGELSEEIVIASGIAEPKTLVNDSKVTLYPFETYYKMETDPDKAVTFSFECNENVAVLIGHTPSPTMYPSADGLCGSSYDEIYSLEANVKQDITVVSSTNGELFITFSFISTALVESNVHPELSVSYQLKEVSKEILFNEWMSFNLKDHDYMILTSNEEYSWIIEVNTTKRVVFRFSTKNGEENQISATATTVLLMTDLSKHIIMTTESYETFEMKVRFNPVMHVHNASQVDYSEFIETKLDLLIVGSPNAYLRYRFDGIDSKTIEVLVADENWKTLKDAVAINSPLPTYGGNVFYFIRFNVKPSNIEQNLIKGYVKMIYPTEIRLEDPHSIVTSPHLGGIAKLVKFNDFVVLQPKDINVKYNVFDSNRRQTISPIDDITKICILSNIEANDVFYVDIYDIQATTFNFSLSTDLFYLGLNKHISISSAKKVLPFRINLASIPAGILLNNVNLTLTDAEKNVLEGKLFFSNTSVASANDKTLDLKSFSLFTLDHLTTYFSTFETLYVTLYIPKSSSILIQMQSNVDFKKEADIGSPVVEKVTEDMDDRILLNVPANHGPITELESIKVSVKVDENVLAKYKLKIELYVMSLKPFVKEVYESVTTFLVKNTDGLQIRIYTVPSNDLNDVGTDEFTYSISSEIVTNKHVEWENIDGKSLTTGSMEKDTSVVFESTVPASSIPYLLNMITSTNVDAHIVISLSNEPILEIDSKFCPILLETCDLPSYSQQQTILLEVTALEYINDFVIELTKIDPYNLTGINLNDLHFTVQNVAPKVFLIDVTNKYHRLFVSVSTNDIELIMSTKTIPSKNCIHTIDRNETFSVNEYPSIINLELGLNYITIYAKYGSNVHFDYENMYLGEISNIVTDFALSPYGYGVIHLNSYANYLPLTFISTYGFSINGFSSTYTENKKYMLILPFSCLESSGLDVVIVSKKGQNDMLAVKPSGYTLSVDTPLTLLWDMNTLIIGLNVDVASYTIDFSKPTLFTVVNDSAVCNVLTFNHDSLIAGSELAKIGNPVIVLNKPQPNTVITLKKIDNPSDPNNGPNNIIFIVAGICLICAGVSIFLCLKKKKTEKESIYSDGNLMVLDDEADNGFDFQKGDFVKLDDKDDNFAFDI